MSGLLVAGTASDAGKSVLVTGLCRAAARRGIAVAPFKAQNMSNNSMACADGSEIGRAQWIQARAAGAVPEAAMNPVLLKPGGDTRSHVVVLGKPAGNLATEGWVASRGRLGAAALAAYGDLADRYELVIAEGAGSPAEINLRDGDFVNMGLARHAGMPVVIVGDIDRGGLFGALYGTIALLEPADQRLIAGFAANKFRGDLRLLEPGLRRLAELTGRECLGVVPWHPDLWLDSEDALDVDARRADPSAAGRRLRVAVVRFPRISNFTDVDPLAVEPDVEVVFASSPSHLAGADLVILPGTRATLADLGWMTERGISEAVLAHAREGGAVVGLCGGAQMLGGQITDPDGIEGSAGARGAGLGLIEGETRFTDPKRVGLVSGAWRGHPVAGYEIHHGRLEVGQGADFPGGTRRGAVFATMWHGCLEGDAFRQALLADVARARGWARAPTAVDFAALREARLELLGDLVCENLEVDRLLEIAESGAPPGLPVLAPGAG